MVLSTRSSRAKNAPLFSYSSISSRNEPTEEEEPEVINDGVAITQDDTPLTQDEDTNNENATVFDEKFDENYNNPVNNPVNQRTTKAEHVAKQAEVRVADTEPVDPKPVTKAKVPPAKTDEHTIMQAPVPPVGTSLQQNLPPVAPPTPVPKPVPAPATATNRLQAKLDAWIFHFSLPTETITTPGTACPIAVSLTADTIEQQEKQTQEFFNFISQPNTDPEVLNAECTPYTFLVHVPGTRRLKVCYGTGSGVSFGGIRGSTINDKALALSGDLEEGVKYPSVLTFPIQDMFQPTTVKSPSYTQLFDLNLSFGTKPPSSNKTTFFKSSDLTETAKLHHLAPIPAYLVQDHIDNSIDVLNLIDRIQCLQQSNPSFTSTKCELVYKHALNYCLNTLVNRTKKDITVTFPLKHFMGDSEPDANTWKKQRLQQLFPTIFKNHLQPPSTTASTVPPATASTPTSSTTSTSKSTTDDETTRLLKLYLTNQLQQQQSATKDEMKFLGLCESEYDMLLIYCGVTDGDVDKIPQLWHKLAEKNKSKEGKKNEVRSALRNTQVMYKDSKIKITPTLLTMITSRAFEGELSSSKQEATKGLSPFILPPISNNDLDEIIALDQEINEATAISTSDIKKTKITLVEAENYEDLMRYLKEFTNLLEVLFSQQCPLWRVLHDAIEKLMDYTSEERAALLRVSCNAILWIVMRQARAFAAGEMKEPESANAAFTEMMLRINIRCQIEFGGLPATMKKRKADAISTNKNTNNNSNNTNNNNTNNNNNNNRYNNQRNSNNNNNNYTNIEFTDKGIQNQKLANAFRTIHQKRNVHQSPTIWIMRQKLPTCS